MASYSVASGEIGAHAKTLVADTVDTVTFEDDVEVEVFSDGAAALYFTIDGSTPTVGGAGCYFLPATLSSREVRRIAGGGTTIKLISAGTPTYSVARAD